MFNNFKVVLSMLLLSLLFGCGGGESGGNEPTEVKNNRKPVIVGSPDTSIELGEFYSFAPTFSDPDNDTLTFSIENKPSWASFDRTTGVLSGDANEVGSTGSIVISASDGELSASLPAFSIEVYQIQDSSITVNVSGVSDLFDFELALNEGTDTEQVNTLKGVSNFTFANQVAYNQGYSVTVLRHPARQQCEVSNGEGTAAGQDISVDIACTMDESAELFDLNKLHKYRVIITAKEWDALVLDTERARYDNTNAFGRESSSLWTHSEVYKKVQVEHIDSATGAVLETFDNVGFKMRGNTSRQWPEHWVRDVDNEYGQPDRFHFSLKFSEKFDEDESVYACIDASGNPAAVSGSPCWKRVSIDHPEVPENDDRLFKGVEKLNFKYNKDDPSYARELLSHDILNQIGVPTARMAYAAVEIMIVGDDDERMFYRPLPQTYNMGIYMVNEPMDKVFLKRYFGKNGYLFKVGGGDLTETVESDCLPYENDDKAITGYVNSDFCQIGIEKSDPESREEWLGTANYQNPLFVNTDINDGGELSQFAPYRPTFELKEKKKSIVEARQALQSFMLFLQGTPSAEQLEQEFNVDGFIKAQAADIVLGAVDHYARVGNNYFLFMNPLTQKWNYLVYDYDFSFRDRHPDYWGNSTNFQNIADKRIFADGKNAGWKNDESSWLEPVLWDITFSVPENRNKLYQQVKMILDEQFGWDNHLKAKLSDRNELIKPIITSSDISFKQECDIDYKESALGLTEHQPCDAGDISIKDYVQWRTQVLTEELQQAGY